MGGGGGGGGGGLDRSDGTIIFFFEIQGTIIIFISGLKFFLFCRF